MKKPIGIQVIFIIMLGLISSWVPWGHALEYVETRATNTRVYVKVPNTTWSQTKIDQENQEWQALWPNTTLVEDANPNYNCHAYAMLYHWAQNDERRYWIENGQAEKFIEDGSLIKNNSGYVYPGATLGYFDSGEFLHSAIFILGYGADLAISKWHRGPLLTHHVLYTPYSFDSHDDYQNGGSMNGVLNAYVGKAVSD